VIDYQGAGTVEFLYDEDRTDPSNSAFYFMEMNTRLQVEHPVTEMITGQDLVKWQLQIAAGESLPLSQEDVTVEGHAFEVRIYAEDPDNEFLPATGTLNYLRQPQQNNHVRVDTGVRENDEVSAFYDPMIAKLIVWDENRDRALQRMLRALDDYRIAGVKTNLNFLSSLLEHNEFKQANLDTNFIAKYSDDLFKASHDPSNQSLILAALYLLLKQSAQNKSLAESSNDPYSPWHSFTGWRVNQQQQFDVELANSEGEHYPLSISQEGDEFRITLNDFVAVVSGELNNDELIAVIDGHNIRATVSQFENELTVFNKQHTSHFTLQSNQDFSADELTSDGGLTAPMNGTIVAVLVKPGDKVTEGQALVIMEAMKMEYTISAMADGKVSEVFFADGDLVADGAELLSLEEA
jgi:3-methylcrotonyl-CoA carboxylase alpha subunit